MPAPESRPGWIPARSLRAATLIELGRPREALVEIDQLLPLQPAQKPLLMEMKAHCDAALAAAAPLPLSPKAFRIKPAGPVEAQRLTRAWGRRLASGLAGTFKDRFEVRELEANVPGGKPSVREHWVEVQKGSSLEGRIRIVWDSGRPAELVVDVASDVTSPPSTMFSRIFGVLGGAAALVAFGAWIWFAISDWSRIWNRLSWTFSSSGGPRASKLEVFWLVLGWAVGPAFSYVGIALIGSWIDGILRGLRERRLRSFAQQELAGALSAEVLRALEEAARNPVLRSELGLVDSA